jgi:hypothetical protein
MEWVRCVTIFNFVLVCVVFIVFIIVLARGIARWWRKRKA